VLVRVVALAALAAAAACAGRAAAPAASPPENVPGPAPAPAPAPRPAEPPVEGVGTATPADLGAPPADALQSPSGLVSRVLRPGTGVRHPGPRDQVVLHYSLWTQDGALADSSVQRGQPFRARLDQVIPGFAEGVMLMVEGEIRRLWVPEGLAYQGKRLPGTLVFDVELIAIEPAAP
jgi:peptidylprolyl isomerase